MSTNWSIGRFWEEAWQLTKSQPKLWILGIATVVMVTGGGGGGTGNSIKMPSSNSAPKLPVEANSWMVVLERVAPDFGAINPGIYGLFGLESLTLAIFGVVLGVVSSFWAKGVLMVGVNQAAETQEVDLAGCTKTALSKVKPLFMLSVIPMLKLMLVSMGMMILAGIGIAITAKIVMVPVVIGLAVLGWWLVYAVKLLVALQWGIWHLMTTDGLDRVEAFKQGQATAKGNLGKSVGLNILTSLMMGIVSFGVAAVAAIPAMIGIVAMVQQKQMMAWAMVLVVISGLVLIPCLAGLAVVVHVFTTATSNKAFRSLTS